MRKSLISTVATFILLLAFAVPTFAAEPSGETSSKGVVNINTADATQLALLPRIGPAAAERIVQYRKDNGEFAKPTDLMQVKGIGDKMFDLLSPYLVVEGKTTLTTKVRVPRAKKSKASDSQAASK